MTSVRITANDKQLPLLIAFCVANNMGCIIESQSPSIQKASSSFMTPSQSIKNFCGSERMTSRGKLQPSEALVFILDYARRNNLINTDSIRLDDRLQEVFDTKDSYIQNYDFSDRLQKLFTD